MRTKTETKLCLTLPTRAKELTKLSLPDFIKTRDKNKVK
jgi:hypothetical protein